MIKQPEGMRYEQWIDENIVAAMLEVESARLKLHCANEACHRAAGDRKTRNPGKEPEWGMTLKEARARLLHDSAVIQAIYHALHVLEDATDTLESWQDLYTGWSRFFLVTSSQGHIHSSTGCSTCLPTTRFGWLPSVSGLTEKEAVEQHGERLCSVCFPSAPVQWTEGHWAKKKAELCPSSGKYVPVGTYNPKLYSPWTKCPDCGKVVSVTPTGKYRGHKPA